MLEVRTNAGVTRVGVDQMVEMAPSKVLEIIDIGVMFGVPVVGDQEHAQVRGGVQEVRGRSSNSDDRAII